MAIQQAKITITGITPLLQANPQTVDSFNRYSKAMKAITNKRTAKTEDDLLELGRLEVEAKLHYDDDIGVYVPATWLTESIIAVGFSVAKIGRAKMRGGLFATENKIPLEYQGKKKIKKISDIIMNPTFIHRMILPQGAVRVAKNAPIFRDWSFETVVEFDDTVVDFGSLANITKRAAKYGGYGDFRPTFGRAEAEIENV